MKSRAEEFDWTDEDDEIAGQVLDDIAAEDRIAQGLPPLEPGEEE